MGQVLDMSSKFFIVDPYVERDALFINNMTAF